MADLQSLECPTCGGPLDLDVSGARSIRCKYCGTSIVIPEELRDERPEGIARLLQSDTIHLREIIQLIRADRKMDAIRVYREQTGVGLKEAKETIDRLAEGKVVQVSNITIETQPISENVYPDREGVSAPKSKRKRGAAIFGCLFAVAITLTMLSFFVIFALDMTGGMDGLLSFLNLGGNQFGEEILTFGGEGTGQGLSTDARTITADGSGHVYLADREYNRIHVFDENGSFVTSWVAAESGFVGNMTADGEGSLFIEISSDLRKFDAMTGELLEEIRIEDCDRIVDIKVDISGIKTLICEEYVHFDPYILRIGPQGETILRIDSLSDLLGDTDDAAMLAVDGSGNIFVVSDWENVILKFSPEGNLISRFGGEGDEPDQFVEAQDIEIDGLGRVYVSDMFGEIRLFDNDGRFIRKFKGASEGMVIVNNFDLYVIEGRHTIVRYALPQE